VEVTTVKSVNIKILGAKKIPANLSFQGKNQWNQIAEAID